MRKIEEAVVGLGQLVRTFEGVAGATLFEGVVNVQRGCAIIESGAIESGDYYPADQSFLPIAGIAKYAFVVVPQAGCTAFDVDLEWSIDGVTKVADLDNVAGTTSVAYSLQTVGVPYVRIQVNSTTGGKVKVYLYVQGG